MLVKFISDQRVERYKGFVAVDGVLYANDEVKAAEQGFKPLVSDEKPAVTEGYYPVSYYEEDEETVHLCWRLEPIEESEEEDRLDTLENDVESVKEELQATKIILGVE